MQCCDRSHSTVLFDYKVQLYTLRRDFRSVTGKQRKKVRQSLTAVIVNFHGSDRKNGME